MTESILFRQKRKIDQLQKAGADLLERAASECCRLEDELMAVRGMLEDTSVDIHKRVQRAIEMVDEAVE